MSDQDNNNQQGMAYNGQQVMPNNNLGEQNLAGVQPVVNTMEVNPNQVTNVYPQQNLNGTFNYQQANSTLNQQNLGAVQADISYPQPQQFGNNMGVNPNQVTNVYPQQDLNGTFNYQQQNLNPTVPTQQVPTNNTNNQNFNSTPVVNNQPTVNSTSAVNNQQVAETDEGLLKVFIGINYDKIATKKFNFAGFFLTSLYLFYRKMFLYGILVFFINFLVMNLINPDLSIIMNILVGLFVNKIYLKFATGKINKIKVNNAQADMNSLLQICARKGGVSVGNAVLGTFVCFFISIIVIIVMFFVGITTVINSLFLNQNETIETGNNNTFNGMISYNTSIKIKDEFSMSVPSKFEDKSGSYEYNFEYDGTEGVFNTCSVSLSAINGYNDAHKLIEQMADYYSSDVTVVKLNGTDWKSFSSENGFGTTYYYGTTKDKKAYLLEYKINEDADSDCASYREEILSSIKAK